MRKPWRIAATAITATALAVSLAGCASNNEKSGFTPKLDTKAQEQLDIVGYFGNFEALDQVVADFNKTYPNVTVNYQQVGSKDEEKYLEANGGTDIFMTSADTLAPGAICVSEHCADLNEHGIDTSAIDETMLASSKVDGKQLSIPMGQSITGLVVNKTLLEKEGLSVPTTKDEFLSTLAALKEKGYDAPIQGPTSKVYADLTAGMTFTQIGTDNTLQNQLKAGDASASSKLEPSFEFMNELIKDGYLDQKVNATYPNDNYDKAIMSFFEGNVPFWACNSEKVSGMKKRESKSEAFSANPFEYTFINVPSGESGQYAYREPWYGFALSKTSDCSDYATEFMRFMATKDEINTLSSVKGVPSVAKEPVNDDIYQNVLSSEALDKGYVNDGSVTSAMEQSWYTVATAYASGEYKSADEAAKAYVESCKE